MITEAFESIVESAHRMVLLAEGDCVQWKREQYAEAAETLLNQADTLADDLDVFERVLSDVDQVLLVLSQRVALVRERGALRVIAGGA